MKTKTCYETHTDCNGPTCNQDTPRAGHTPGPWKAQGHEIIAAARPSWQLKIAILPTTVDPRPTPDAAATTLGERDANAKLIAKAPAMLSALQHVHGMLDKLATWTSQTPEARQFIADAQNVIEHTLAR